MQKLKLMTLIVLYATWQILGELFDKAAENIQSAQQRYKADYDKRRADPMVHLLMIKIRVT